MGAIIKVLPERRVWRATHMILVLFGTNPYPFTRLATAIAEIAISYNGEIIAQTGSTPAEIPGVKCEQFIDHSKLIELMSEASLVICQGGFGSITDALRLRKPVIAVPRLNRLHETAELGLGQMAIVQEFEKAGLLIGIYEIEKLKEAVKNYKSFESSSIDPSRIPEMIEEDINKWLS